MYPFSIGVMLDSFKVDTATALDKAVSVGASGLQVYATYGELAPENMTPQKRRDFLKAVRDHGLTISALCGDLGHGFGDEELNPGLIEKSKRILDLAKDLETNVVTTHIGVVPKDPEHPRFKIMQAACRELAQRFAMTPDIEHQERMMEHEVQHFYLIIGLEFAVLALQHLITMGTKILQPYPAVWQVLKFYEPVGIQII